MSKILQKQVFISQSTAVRAIVHRAAADMERWRRSAGARQEAEVVAYWTSWHSHMHAASNINERLLAYMRAAAAAAEAYAVTMRMAADTIAPIASGEVLAAANASPAYLAAVARGEGADASSSSSASSSPFSFFYSSSSTAASTTSASGSGTFIGSGTGKMDFGLGPLHAAHIAAASSATGVGAPAAGTAAGAAAAGGSAGSGPAFARHGHTLSQLAHTMNEVQQQAADLMHEVAVVLSREVCGDADGPLGPGLMGGGVASGAADGKRGASAASAAAGGGGSSSGATVGPLTTADGKPVTHLPLAVADIHKLHVPVVDALKRFAAQAADMLAKGGAPGAPGGKDAVATAAAASSSASSGSSGGPSGGVHNPRDLLALFLWYAALTEAMRSAGSALVECLRAVSDVASETFEDFEAHCSALVMGAGLKHQQLLQQNGGLAVVASALYGAAAAAPAVAAAVATPAAGSGSADEPVTAPPSASSSGASAALPMSITPLAGSVAGGPSAATIAALATRYKGKDLWLTELRYRRAARVALAVRQRFMDRMAVLFERYRVCEHSRSEAIAYIAERHSAITSKTFDRVSNRAVLEAVKTLNTHADFFRVVQEDTLSRIEAMRTRWRQGEAEARAAAAAAAAEAADGTDGEAAGAAADASAAAVAAAAPPAAAPTRPTSFHFHLDPSPAVISPLCSPLVVRCGLLLRQVGVLRSWKSVFGVLTWDGNLHLFSPESEDLATHPDVLAAINRWSAERPSTNVHMTGGTAAAAGSKDAAAAAAAVASSAAATAVQIGGATTVQLPPPALPPHVMAMAASYAANTSDLQLGAATAGTTGDGSAAAAAAAAPSATAYRSAAAGASGLLSSFTSAVAAAASDGSGGSVLPNVGGPAGESWLIDRAQKASTPPGQTWPITPSTKLQFAPATHADAFELSDRTGFLGFKQTLLLRAASPDDCVDWVVACNHVIDLVTHERAMGEQ